MAISQIPALLWKLIFGRLSVGRSTPHHMGISQISALTTHISFLLWELIIWQTRSWQVCPPHPMVILKIPVLTAHYSESFKWQFHRFLWNSYFIPTLTAQHLADQFLADVTSHIRWQIHRFLLYSESSYMADWVLADQHPPSYGNFTDFCSDSSYFIPTLTAPHLADQVLVDLPPSSKAISQIPALLWEFIFGRPSVGRCTPLSNGNFADFCSDSSYFIPTLRAHHLADQVLTDLPPIQWWFYRFLLWQLSALRAYHLADQVLADLPPHQTAISQISALLWELIFSRPPCQMVISQIPALTAH